MRDRLKKLILESDILCHTCGESTDTYCAEALADHFIANDVVEVVRCKDCDVPHNRWTGCPNLNGLIPPPDFYCARGERKPQTVDATDTKDGHKSPCKVCERITEANKDIFWVFARTHQYEHQEEFWKIPYEAVRFCPVCGREIGKINNMTTIL